jgi:hypothetical protein
MTRAGRRGESAVARISISDLVVDAALDAKALSRIQGGRGSRYRQGATFAEGLRRILVRTLSRPRRGRL